MNQPTTEFDVLAAFRADFPALKKWAYMDVAGRGVPSATTRAALDAHMNERMYEGGDKDRMFALIERARGRFAELINADADEVTYTKNISEGLNMVATGLNLKAGDNVIVCADLEHPNNVYAWLNLQRNGVEVRMVKSRNNTISADDLIARIDDRARSFGTLFGKHHGQYERRHASLDAARCTRALDHDQRRLDRKSTRLNSSH